MGSTIFMSVQTAGMDTKPIAVGFTTTGTQLTIYYIN